MILAGANIGFLVNLTSAFEGSELILAVSGVGYSYGTIPVQVTPLPCSDYPGNITALFGDIPIPMPFPSTSAGMCVS